MKKIIIPLFILILLSVFINAYTFNNTVLDEEGININLTNTAYDQYLELHTKMAFDCATEIGYSLLTDNTLVNIITLRDPFKSKTFGVDICNQAKLYDKYIIEANNITDTYNSLAAKQLDQIGLQEYVYEKEKEQILVNVNTAWEYVQLLFNIFTEIIMIFFYVFELYLVTYLLFIVLPKAFLKIRDGVSIFLVRKLNKKEGEKK